LTVLPDPDIIRVNMAVLVYSVPGQSGKIHILYSMYVLYEHLVQCVLEVHLNFEKHTNTPCQAGLESWKDTVTWAGL
jgi:hypothetical protein